MGQNWGVESNILLSMDETKTNRIWQIVRTEADRLAAAAECTSLDVDDLAGYGWERILLELAAGHESNNDHIRRWARFGMIEALRRESGRPQPIGWV